MTDDAADFFRFLTNSYLAEPTDDNARRLWRAVFALEGLYFLLRPVGSQPVPALAVNDGVTHLLVWTDLESLQDYVSHTAEGDSDEVQMNGAVATNGDSEPQYLFAPMPKVIEHVLRYEEHGVQAVRFNAPVGWSVPMERLRAVAQHLGAL